MFSMSQHQYTYPAAPAPVPRHYSGHTSSAFSSSANPDEDWTKISDLAERRRIQNRIAQRNYRKKLKRRLEDLERRAGGDGPAASDNKNKTKTSSKNKSVSTASRTPQVAKPVSHCQPPYTPPMQDDLLFPHTYDDRERSHTPPMFPYSSYPNPDEVLMAPYGSSPAYPTITTAEAYPSYLPTAVPVTLPPMTHFSDAMKSNGDSLSPYMNYGYMPGIDVNAPHAYDHSNPHTPPLSHSFDHSTNCSESGYEYPTTPLSMPGSPGTIHQ